MSRFTPAGFTMKVKPVLSSLYESITSLSCSDAVRTSRRESSETMLSGAGSNMRAIT